LMIHAVGVTLDVCGGPTPALLHELVELLLVLRHSQTAQEVLKLALLLFEATQSFGPIIIEGLIARARRSPPRSGSAHFIHAAGPTAHFPRTHPSAPDQKGQDRKSDRP